MLFYSKECLYDSFKRQYFCGCGWYEWQCVQYNMIGGKMFSYHVNQTPVWRAKGQNPESR
jgi:hypothetical protein